MKRLWAWVIMVALLAITFVPHFPLGIPERLMPIVHMVSGFAAVFFLGGMVVGFISSKKEWDDVW